MRDVDTGPLLNPTDKVKFLESHRPSLMDGDYRVSVTHDVPGLDIAAQRDLTFAVTGPRFALAPTEVASMFPPKGAKGRFENVLPHIILNRTTLPWERSATLEQTMLPGAPEHDPAQPKKTPPWLALLVFEANEIEGRTQVVQSRTLMAAQTGVEAADPQPGDSFAILRRSTADKDDTAVLVLDLPADLALNLLPRTGDLRYMASVRDVRKTAADPTTEDRAVLMANRLPTPGARTVVHLVSLEHQYRLIPNADAAQGWWHTHEHWARQHAPGDTLRLVSLAQWDFICDDTPGDLQAVLDGLGATDLTLPMDGLGASAAAVYAGAVPVRYNLASGDKTAAWYKGPCHPVPRSTSLPLPVRHADDLLTTDAHTGMTDISYAAAWEMGRMLALKDPAIGIRLGQWKRQATHHGHAQKHAELAAELGHAAPGAPGLPDDIRAWFDTALIRLAAVPFDYLVADPAVLPPETLSRFVIDRMWIDALMDGAFSIGRASRAQLETDRALRRNLPGMSPAGRFETVQSGILLRSRAVRDWPELVVDGFVDMDQFGEGIPQPATPIRYERIGRDIVLVLFEGLINGLDIHLHPMAIHFGVDGSDETGFSKFGDPVPFRANPPGRLDIGALASRAAAQGSHDFAFEMIERAPKVSYRFELLR